MFRSLTRLSRSKKIYTRSFSSTTPNRRSGLDKAIIYGGIIWLLIMFPRRSRMPRDPDLAYDEYYDE